MAEEQLNKPKNTNPLVGSKIQARPNDLAPEIDIDTSKHLIDLLIEAGLSSKLDTAALENFTSIANSRDQVYQMIDTMAQDSSVSSILRTYAADACDPSDNGHIIWCESDDPKVSKFGNYILNVMNADKNIYGWMYSLLKYGDLYLRLFRNSDYNDSLFDSNKVDSTATARSSLTEAVVNDTNKLEESINLNIHQANDHYSFYVEEVPDPSTMFELTKFGKTYGYIEVPNQQLGTDSTETFTGVSANAFNFKLKSADVNVYQADDFVHACLEDNFTRFPETVELFIDNKEGPEAKSQSYGVRRGKSLLYDSYKVWREKSLLENAALLNRITRSSVVRKVGVEVGDMPKEQAQQALRRVKDMFEQKAALNVGESMSEYNNPGPMENNIYYTTHEGKGAITIDSVGGDVDVKNLADLDWWNNKFYSSYGVPKQYFGWTDDAAGFNGGSSLSIISSVYAKGVRHCQNAIIQAITDCLNLFFIDRGMKSFLNKFTIKMKSPATQEEIDYRNELTNKISAISNLQSLFSDIEDKGRRLQILKALLKPLNYGDELNQIIEAEIAAAELVAEEDAENTDADSDSTDTTPIDDGSADDELGSLDSISNESFLNHDGEPLLEEAELVESDTLPTPEELAADKDFTENN